MCLTVFSLIFLAFAMFSCVHMRFTGQKGQTSPMTGTQAKNRCAVGIPVKS